jgi:hypothetical protein
VDALDACARRGEVRLQPGGGRAKASSSSLIRPLATSPRLCPPIPSATAHKPAAGRSTTLSSL